MTLTQQIIAGIFVFLTALITGGIVYKRNTSSIKINVKGNQNNVSGGDQDVSK